MNHEGCHRTGTLATVDQSPGAVVARLRPLLLSIHEALSHGVTVSAAIHVAHGWNPTADRHLDHQLVRREAMERLKPWGADPDELSDPPLARQLQFADASTDNLGLPMSGLILRTPTDVLRVWRSDDGELPAAATDGLRAFYRQAAADWPGPNAGHPSSEPGTAIGLVTGSDAAIRGAPSTRARAGRSSARGSRSGSSRAPRRGSGRR